MPDLSPVAFMSYTHLDDKSGQITTLRERLSDEVRVQTGEDFRIFQDVEGIKLGQNWRRRIEGSLDEVTFLIPILTPSFFKSDWCRNEVLHFHRRETALGRDDLILPIYFVSTPYVDDPARRDADEVAGIIAAHQYADWRQLRIKGWTAPDVLEVLVRVAEQIRDALARVGQSAVAPAGRAAPAPLGDAGAQSRPTSVPTPQKERQAQGQTEPPTRIVDPMSRGDHTSIIEAIEAAHPGDRILVRPGLYVGRLKIDKPLEIVGTGDAGDAVVQAERSECVLFVAPSGRIANLTLRQIGGREWHAVDVAQGRLDLEDCDLTSANLSCLAVHGYADPMVRRNRIHDGGQAGIVVYENGRGTFEDNDVFGNALAGIAVQTGGDPTFRRNRIHDGKQGGIVVSENGRGTFEDNEVYGNALSGIEVGTDGDPTVRRNRIHDGKRNGIFVYENGRGTFEDNDVVGNEGFGVLVQEGGRPTLRSNRINGNRHAAVFVGPEAGGVFLDNDLRGSKHVWDIDSASDEAVERSGNLE